MINKPLVIIDQPVLGVKPARLQAAGEPSGIPVSKVMQL